MNWRGWVKMAFNQPLLPVLPVARELISKTRWKSSKSSHTLHESPLHFLHPRYFAIDANQSNQALAGGSQSQETSSQVLPSIIDKDPPIISSLPLTAEPESMALYGNDTPGERPTTRKRVKSLFSRRNKSRSKSTEPTKVGN
jgi:hypothetical protein